MSLCAVQSPPEMPLAAVNTKLDGQDAYATSDLVEPHPTKPNYWRIFGRADEQIILSNGEKVSLATQYRCYLLISC